MPLPKLKNSFVSETGIRFCAIDSRISFLALAIASKKISIAIYVHVTHHAPWKIFTEPWKPEFQPWTAKFVFWELFLTI